MADENVGPEDCEAWMEIKIVVPAHEGREILHELRPHGFSQRDEDWCVEKRAIDQATVDYAPIEEPPDRRMGW